MATSKRERVAAPHREGGTARLNILAHIFSLRYHKGVLRRAVLIFAEEAHLDLARRAFPEAARPLFNLPTFDSELSSGIDVHVFTSRRGHVQERPRFHRQTGSTFAARLENAVAKISGLGYDEVVVVGRDCPSLRATDIERAFAELKARTLVLGPDHRGGCYLIAFHARNRGLLHGVRWNQDTDCAQLCQRCPASNVFLLPVKHDLDSWADLRLFARCGDALARLAFFLVALLTTLVVRVSYFVDLAIQDIRVRWQMPPPAFAN